MLRPDGPLLDTPPPPPPGPVCELCGHPTPELVPVQVDCATSRVMQMCPDAWDCMDRVWTEAGLPLPSTTPPTRADLGQSSTTPNREIP